MTSESNHGAKESVKAASLETTIPQQLDRSSKRRRLDTSDESVSSSSVLEHHQNRREPKPSSPSEPSADSSRPRDSRNPPTATPSNELPRKLTVAEQTALTQELDDALLELERDVNKRTDPSSPVPSLTALLSRLEPIFNKIMSIPPVSPTAFTRVQYLLRLTSGLRDFITGYSVTGHGVIENEKPKKSVKGSRLATTMITKTTRIQSRRNLLSVLAFLDTVDQGWRAVLLGEVWEPDRHTQSRHNTDESRLKRDQAVSATEVIRLRSSLLSLRSRILSWAEIQSAKLAIPGPRRPAADVVDDSETDGISTAEHLVGEEGEGENEAKSGMSDTGTGTDREEDHEWDWRLSIVKCLQGTLDML